MNGDKLTYDIEDKSTEDFECFKALVKASNKEFEEKSAKELPLSEYSTTQLKAELRRRKAERRCRR